MRHIHKAQQKHYTPPSPVAPPTGQQQIVAVGMVQHLTTGHYQVWLPARGQTTLLLAIARWRRRTPPKWRWATPSCAGISRPRMLVRGHAVIGTNADAPLEPVSDAVFASISAPLQRAELVALDAPTHNSLALPTRIAPDRLVRSRQDRFAVIELLRLRVQRQGRGGQWAVGAPLRWHLKHRVGDVGCSTTSHG